MSDTQTPAQTQALSDAITTHRVYLQTAFALRSLSTIAAARWHVADDGRRPPNPLTMPDGTQVSAEAIDLAIAACAKTAAGYETLAAQIMERRVAL